MESFTPFLPFLVLYLPGLSLEYRIFQHHTKDLTSDLTPNPQSITVPMKKSVITTYMLTPSVENDAEYEKNRSKNSG